MTRVFSAYGNQKPTGLPLLVTANPRALPILTASFPILTASSYI